MRDIAVFRWHDGAMKLKESFTYPGTTVESVYAIITDQAFREEAADADGAIEKEISVEPNDKGGDTVTIVRTQPADMPDFIKKLTGETVKVKQTEVWTGPDADGNRTAAIKVSIIGQPAGMEGTATLDGSGADAAFNVDGDVKVSIPFIGKKIEPEIHKAITGSLRGEVALGVERLS